MNPSPHLQVYLFDSPLIENGEGKHATTSLEIPRLQTRALFYRLAVRLTPVARDQLCFLFWPDAPDLVARRNLTLLLSHLRRALPTPELLITSPEYVQLDAARVWSDSALFAQLCVNSNSALHLKDLETAVTLYRGLLLSSFVPPHDSPEYDLWLSSERQSYERMALDTLATLVETFTARGNVEEAIPYARRYLEIDALAEDVHRQLMRLYALAGDRSAARRQFDLCVEVLERELGVSPLPETYAVYDAILKDQLATVPRAIKEPIWTTLAGPQVALTGRQQAWQSLRNFYTQAAEKRGGVVLLAGEAGIGKSRLMQEFVSHLPSQVSVLTAASYPGVQSIPYQPIIEALRPALQAYENLAELSQSWLSVATLLFPEIRSLFPHLPASVLLDPEQARGQIFEALCQLLLFLSHRSLVLLCLDDLHWADSTTLDWLSYVARYLRHSRLLILGTYRSEEANSLSELRIHLNRLRVLSELHLASLGIDEVQQMLTHFYQGESHLEMLATRLQTITGGNPFFLLESVQALKESGLSPATFHAVSELPISSTVRATIEQRMQGLQPMARQVLEAGAVLGPSFDFEDLRQTAGRHEMEAIEGLDELVARRFVEEQGTRYRFCHELIQAVVYQTLSYWRRQLLHRRAAEMLEQYHVDPFDPASGQIADHYARGGLPAQAVPFYQRAAEVAARRFVHKGAIVYLNAALTLLEMLPPTTEKTKQELVILLATVDNLVVVEGFTAREVATIYTKVAAILSQIDDDRLRFRACQMLHSFSGAAGQMEQAHTYAEELLRLALQLEDPIVLLDAHRACGIASLQLGRFHLAKEHLAEGEAIYKRIFSTDTGSRRAHTLLANLAFTLWLLGYPDQARAKMAEALALAEKRAEPWASSIVYFNATLLYRHMRETQRVAALTERMLALHAQYDIKLGQQGDLVIQGWLLAEEGNFKEGIALMRAGIDEVKAMNHTMFQTHRLGLLVEVQLNAGQLETASATLEEAFAMAEHSGQQSWDADLYRLKGDLLCAADVSAPEAQIVYEQAIAIARQQGAKSLELRATVRLSQLLQHQGKRSEARQRLTEVYGWFGEGFDTPDLEQAHSLLQLLSL